MEQVKNFNLAMLKLVVLSIVSIIGISELAEAREARYTGDEITVFVQPGEPTQVTFPNDIEGGFKKSRSSLALERQENFLIIFAQPVLPPEGEAIIVHLNDKRSYAMRILPANAQQPRDDFVSIMDERPPELEGEDEGERAAPTGFAPPTMVSGLMREMMLVAEFGKQRGVTGYRRSNRYSGETVLHDGAVKATIDEIFMGPNLWGYVLNVENLLDTTQRLNPAAFRLDGTRAVAMEHWELAPRALTEEQKKSNADRSKVYIITRSKRR